MKKSAKLLLLCLFAFNLAVLASSCEKGPAEKLGEKIDNGVQNTKDAARDLKDDVTKHRN
jgi:hypothetical protein